VTTKWRKEPAVKSPTIRQSGNIVSLENSYTKVVLSTNGGLRLISLVNKYADQEMIQGNGSKNLFEIYDTTNKNKRYANTDFKATEVKGRPDQRIIHARAERWIGIQGLDRYYGGQHPRTPIRLQCF